MTVRPGFLKPASRRAEFAAGLGLWALLVLAALLFRPALGGPFLFDDSVNLEALRHVGGDFSIEGARRLLAALGSPLNRPLAMLSFLIEDAAWPSDPYAFKRDNLAFHLLAGVGAFALARALAGRLGAQGTSRDAVALATCAAWLLHPLQMSATMLVVQRMNLLSTAFVLAGLLAYLAVLVAPRGGPRLRIATALSALGLGGVLAFLCKQNGVLIFAYAAVLNATVLDAARLRLSRRLWIALCVATLAPLLLLLGLALANPEYVLAPYRSRDFTLGERLLTQPRVLFEYLRVIVLPRVGGQGLYHDDYPASRGLFDPPATMFALLALVAAAGFAWRTRRHWPVASFAVGWFLAGHAMESSFIGLELYFEHRNYLPMLGPLFGLAWLALRVRYPRLARTGLSLWLLLAAGLTALAAPVWGDRGRLAEVWLRENPTSVRAIQFAGAWLHDAGDYAAARAVFERGQALRPEARELHFQQVLLDCLNVGVSDAQWQALVADATRSNNARVIPDVVTAFRIQAGGPACRGTLRRAQVRALVEALVDNPTIAREPIVLGFLHYELARLAEQERDLDAVMHHLEESHRWRPNPMVLREQALHLLSAGLPDEALQALDRSEAVPRPFGQAWVQDLAAMNAPLRESAERMRRTLTPREPPAR